MMQSLSLLLVCMLAVQSASAIRFASVPNKQYVQVAIAFRGVTCADTPKGANLLRNGARDSVKAYFSSQGYSQTIIDSTAGLLDTECVDSSNSRTTFASFRASVSFSGLNSTDDRDFLFNAFRQGPCRGGYDVETYGVLADAIAAADLTVAYNKAARNNPFGARGWIDFVTADNCRVVTSPAPSSPSPVPDTSSPAPTNETSPSPLPESPSPAPGNTSSSPDPSSPSPNPSSTSPDPSSTSPDPSSSSPEPSTSPDPSSSSPDPSSTSPDPSSSSPDPSTSPDPSSTSPDPSSSSPDPSPSPPPL